MTSARRFTDPDQLAAAMAQAAARVGPAIALAVRHEAVVLQTLIQAAASGRPGPNAITGRYRASWQAQVHPHRHGATATVGTFAPQARRLELGFYGADALGRVYAQPPLPHVAPALALLQPRFAERIATAAMGAFE
ncbi:hypothetical protein [Streptomyces javensis]|uniref:HK97 gp10 family phage protein n=1 Tax=Streptomyces javensis TaxID=114698 RepID=A0ABS0R6L2_9ACTN|nr:hypothetical protein [Streptomyces javensis]MBI0313017.1 hypothetical protein [Streptomyces javensis]